MENYNISYRIRTNQSDREPPREIQVHAAPEQIAALVSEGYIVRSALFAGSELEALRDAADEVEARHLEREAASERIGFSGLFVRNIVDEHPVFENLLLRDPRLLSVARAVSGPQVQLHASVLRVAYPELANQGVEWHFHQRVVPDPYPAFFVRPVVVDNLLYLDELTPDSGPLVVLPGTHKTDDYLPSGDFSDKQGQVVVSCPAGSVITSHSSLWHKAVAPKPGGKKRRLLIIGYSSVWLKQTDTPKGLRERIEADGNADNETRELAGIRGSH